MHSRHISDLEEVVSSGVTVAGSLSPVALDHVVCTFKMDIGDGENNTCKRIFPKRFSINLQVLFSSGILIFLATI